MQLTAQNTQSSQLCYEPSILLFKLHVWVLMHFSFFPRSYHESRTPIFSCQQCQAGVFQWKDTWNRRLSKPTKKALKLALSWQRWACFKTKTLPQSFIWIIFVGKKWKTKHWYQHFLFVLWIQGLGSLQQNGNSKNQIVAQDAGPGVTCRLPGGWRLQACKTWMLDVRNPNIPIFSCLREHKNPLQIHQDVFFCRTGGSWRIDSSRGEPV